tara:strand:- start:28650 stop:29144 length:495 start_codon:yes stop_codon:yes gene_type:complete
MSKREELKNLVKHFTKEELIEILSEPSEVDNEQTVHKIGPEKKRNRRGRGGRKKKKEARGGRQVESKGNPCRTTSLPTSEKRHNKFIDFMENTTLNASEKSELEAASKADKEGAGQRPPREVRSSSLVEVECRICGVSKDVSQNVVYDANRWKCNQCSAQACDE